MTTNTAIQFEYNYGGHVDSSFIEAVCYNVADKELAVVFSAGTTFIYRDVPAHVAKNVIDADSIGHEYDRLVKSRYDVGAYSNDTDLIEFSFKLEPTPVNEAVIDEALAATTKTYAVNFDLNGELVEFYVQSYSLSDAVQVASLLLANAYIVSASEYEE